MLFRYYYYLYYHSRDGLNLLASNFEHFLLTKKINDFKTKDYVQDFTHVYISCITACAYSLGKSQANKQIQDIANDWLESMHLVKRK